MAILRSIKNFVKTVFPFPVWVGLRSLYWRLRGLSSDTFYDSMVRKAGRLAPVHNGPLISILCNTWNTPSGYLEQMLLSIRQQSYRNWELLINNCSDPGHPEVKRILRAFSEKDDRIKVFNLENLGISLNTNAVAARASGEFILLMDHDDFLTPDALESLMAAQKQKNADFVYSDEYYLRMSCNLVLYRRKMPFSMEALESDNYVNHPALIRKTLFDQVHGFRTGFEGSQDYDLYLRLFEQTDNIAYVPKGLYVWRIHPVSFSQSALQHCIDSGKKALEEHFKRIGVPAVVESAKNEARFKVVLLKK